ncbi:hypothetical protein PHMEG_00032685, partial [Phytophthora megakarya]
PFRIRPHVSTMVVLTNDKKKIDGMKDCLGFMFEKKTLKRHINGSVMTFILRAGTIQGIWHHWCVGTPHIGLLINHYMRTILKGFLLAEHEMHYYFRRSWHTR